MTETKVMTPRVWHNQFKKALVIENPHPKLDAYLTKMGIEAERLETPPSSEAELVDILQRGGHNLIFKRSRVGITEAVVQASPNLFGVILCCIGDDSVDKAACANAGVMVLNDPISNGRSVVELVLGEMIAMGRRLFEAAEDTNANRWTKSGSARYELRGKTVGVLGLGNIGKQVAQICAAFGMNIVFYDSLEVAREVGELMGWRAASSIDELFELSHVVTLHVSASDVTGKSNEGLVTQDMLMSLGSKVDVPGPKLFINAARGFVYEPADLLAAVEARAIDYAFVDVFPQEPRREGEAWINPYAQQPRIYATPHIGASTQEAQPRIARHVAGSTRLFSCYGLLRNCVYSPKTNMGIPEAMNPKHVLAVVHSDQRGTKKAISETIFDAGLSNLSSTHRDFPEHGIAYDVNAINGALTDEQIQGLIERAARNTGDPNAVRSVRMINVCNN